MLQSQHNAVHKANGYPYPDFRFLSLCDLKCWVSGVRRLVIVEAGSKRVEGIVSLGDIFKFLLG